MTNEPDTIAQRERVEAALVALLRSGEVQMTRDDAEFLARLAAEYRRRGLGTRHIPAIFDLAEIYVGAGALGAVLRWLVRWMPGIAFTLIFADEIGRFLGDIGRGLTAFLSGGGRP